VIVPQAKGIDPMTKAHRITPEPAYRPLPDEVDGMQLWVALNCITGQMTPKQLRRAVKRLDVCIQHLAPFAPHAAAPNVILIRSRADGAKHALFHQQDTKAATQLAGIASHLRTRIGGADQ
jgi:hypothetical protein